MPSRRDRSILATAPRSDQYSELQTHKTQLIISMSSAVKAAEARIAATLGAVLTRPFDLGHGAQVRPIQGTEDTQNSPSQLIISLSTSVMAAEARIAATLGAVQPRPLELGHGAQVLSLIHI